MQAVSARPCLPASRCSNEAGRPCVLGCCTADHATLLNAEHCAHAGATVHARCRGTRHGMLAYSAGTAVAMKCGWPVGEKGWARRHEL